MEEIRIKSKSEKQKMEDQIISKIFGPDGREAFSKNVKKTLKWNRKGGPKFGTPLFFKDIVGSIQLKSEELIILKREIAKEIRKIEKREDQENQEKKQKTTSDFDEKMQFMIDDASKKRARELKRSGGVDPNEI